MNPLYEYLIYLVLGLTIGGIIVLKLIDIYKKRDDIQISKDSEQLFLSVWIDIYGLILNVFFEDLDKRWIERSLQV